MLCCAVPRLSALAEGNGRKGPFSTLKRNAPEQSSFLTDYLLIKVWCVTGTHTDTIIHDIGALPARCFPADHAVLRSAGLPHDHRRGHGVG